MPAGHLHPDDIDVPGIYVAPELIDKLPSSGITIKTTLFVLKTKWSNLRGISSFESEIQGLKLWWKAIVKVNAPKRIERLTLGNPNANKKDQLT